MSRNKGFTMIELVVATGVFIVVMLISVGALVSMIEANRRAQAATSVLNNVNFAIDSMAREIRVGTDYTCDDTGGESCDVNSGNNAIQFTSAEDETIIYAYDSTGKQILKTVDAGSPLPITSPNIFVEDTLFAILGTVSDDNEQPRVIIIVRGTGETSTGEVVDFDLQTSVTQRVFDIE